MDLELTDDQQELRDAVRSILERECPVSLARHTVESGTYPAELVRTMAKLDWFGLSVPESAGGMGLGFTEVALVVEELGSRVAPGPYLATMTQYVPIVLAAGSPSQADKLLAPVVSGEVPGALAVSDHPRRWDVGGVRATARPDGDGWVLEGTKRAVLANEGGRVAVVARTPADAAGALGVFVVDAEQVTLEPVAALDASRPLYDIHLGGTRVAQHRVLGEPGSPEVEDAITRACEQAAVGLAFEIVGTCQALLDLTVDYAKERKQFGVPIGSFQAIKHKLADDYVSVQRARALALLAVAAIAEDDERRPLAVAMAKAAAGDCQRQVCGDATQTFGGIGFTWEHDLHLYTKRAKTAAALFGGAADHRRMVASAIGLGS